MAITTIRAVQNSYDSTNFPDGNRLLNAEILDISEYMDSPNRRDTPFLNSISKGKAHNQRVHKWGVKGVNPRGSKVGSGGITNNATTLPLPTGEGTRFQQGDVLYLDDGTNIEIAWVVTPAANSLTIARAKSGTGATPGSVGYAFAQDVPIVKIGVAMPEGADFPLGPVSRGEQYWNVFQHFDTKAETTWIAENTPSYEEMGNMHDYDVAQKAGDLKIDLEMAALMSRRHEGSPDPTDNDPSMMSGILHLVETYGNVLDCNGAVLGPDVFEQVFIDLELSVGDAAADTILGSTNSQSLWNRGLNALRQGTLKDTEANLTWEEFSITTGTYKFGKTLRMPDDKVLIYAPSEVEYFAYAGNDWQQEALPSSATKRITGIHGSFSLRVDRPTVCYVLTNFDTDVSHYPALVS